MHCVINFVSDLRQVSGFLHQYDRHDITETLLKVVLKHHNPNPYITVNVYLYVMSDQFFG
jgi:hypothetical protein